jgi:hypothetical protein
LVNIGDIATYDMAKRFFINKMEQPDTFPTHVAASLCSGFAAALLGKDAASSHILFYPPQISLCFCFVRLLYKAHRRTL